MKHELHSDLKPLQNKKGQKIWGTREKSSPFIRKKTAFFSGTPNCFGPSYFEVALDIQLMNWTESCLLGLGTCFDTVNL